MKHKEMKARKKVREKKKGIIEEGRKEGRKAERKIESYSKQKKSQK